MIDHQYIENLLDEAKHTSKERIQEVLDKAQRKEGLNHRDIAILLQVQHKDQLQEIFKIAGDIKKSIYGNRIVVFAPLYVSDYCVNNCLYCGYRRDNDFPRRRLSWEEIQHEVRLLEQMGHKRLALEVGEDPVNCDIDYVLDAMNAIYSTHTDRGEIRRINVNIAATSTENYRKLKEAGIGTYILFQETYHHPTYEAMHPKSLKGNYEYHLSAFDRAMEAGIDDFGAGVLFGLADYTFEVMALMLHNEYLEQKYGVGFHTISVPRLKKAEGMELDSFSHLVSDDIFKKIVAIIRLAVPYTGLILSTRETPEVRREVLRYGVTQISAGSCTGVGGYKESDSGKKVNQFELTDHRSPLEVLKELISDGNIPSYCTACYRQNRTGDRFMQLAKSGQIQNICGPNALMTLMEFALDYGDKELLTMVEAVIREETMKIEEEDLRNLTLKNLENLKNGERDLYF